MVSSIVVVVVVVVVAAVAMMMGMIGADRHRSKTAFDRACGFVAEDLFKFGCQRQRRQPPTENMSVTV